jgi:ribosomal protein L37AE/L43A
MGLASDVPICDICSRREATSVEGGVYRCEYCQTAHQKLAKLDPRDADPEDDEAA